MNITQAKGEGQGTCKKCKCRYWMDFLYRIEGKDGLYCSKCVNMLKKNENNEVRI